jgi:hypothetical protein
MLPPQHLRGVRVYIRDKKRWLGLWMLTWMSIQQAAPVPQRSCQTQSRKEDRILCHRRCVACTLFSLRLRRVLLQVGSMTHLRLFLLPYYILFPLFASFSHTNTPTPIVPTSIPPPSPRLTYVHARRHAR